MQLYKKRLSKGEIDKHAVLVLKSVLKFFPDLDTSFFIAVNCYGKEEKYETTIEKDYCECRGNPHFHFYIDLLPVWQCFSFAAGDNIYIKKTDESYFLELI
ncbi:MAG: hypothetical protein HeimC3_03740 [Candidatus Heimdallarchaeota archaeon LC_3]|nr:MAG: hypothetical protein HeimC3_03740 [Candidatus Heimdallarchaeota archaeon LC_3]